MSSRSHRGRTRDGLSPLSPCFSLTCHRPSGSGVQSQVNRFEAELIHNAENVVAIPVEVHQKINALYQSKPKFAEGKIVREWLRSQSFEEQWKFGKKILNELMER